MLADKSTAAGITIGHLIHRVFTSERDKPAFVTEKTALSYKDCATIVFSLARALTSQGLQSGDGVALLMPNRAETYLLRAACKLVNCRYTPLNALSKVSEWKYVLENSEAKLLAYDPALLDSGSELFDGLKTPIVRQICGSAPDDMMRVAEGMDSSPLWPVGDEEDIYGLLYTGGTTGAPKGVMVSHRARVQQIMVKLAEYPLEEDTSLLLCSPISHGAGSLILPTLLRGGTVHMLDKFNPQKFIETVEKHKINAAWGVPTMVSSLVNCPEIKTSDVSSLQTFIYAGSPITPTLLEEALKIFGSIFIQHYGQTEAPGVVSVLSKKDHDPSRSGLLSSCGRPTVGTVVTIRNENDEEVARNEVGEISVRGRLITSGYWKNEEQTREAYRDGWLRTGDVGKIDEKGYLYITDRKKDMIISGGFNVYPREVEDALAKHPAVQSCAVVGVPDDHWGEVVSALIVLRDGETVTEAELTQFMKNSVGSVKTPKNIVFGASLPATPNAKIDKVAIRKKLAEELK